MTSIVDEIRRAVEGGHPLIYVHTPEEDRVVRALEEIVRDGEGRLSSWTCVQGLDCAPAESDTRDPALALRTVTESPHPGFYIFKDLSEFMDRPEVVRALRDAYYGLRGTRQTHVIIVSPVLTVPELLNNELYLLELPLPDGEQLLEQVRTARSQSGQQPLPDALRSRIALSLRGLTLNQADHVMRRVAADGEATEDEILDQVFVEKKNLMRMAGFLEYIPDRFRVEDIGGLGILKDWALKRRELFTQEAVDKGLPIPRGVLMMGISGCGKSMSAKAIAGLWRVPLFRLDMTLVFSGLYGTPEAAFDRALRAIESISPAVLWIDEIENALGMTTKSSSAEQSLTFSSFLTWMQERPPLVFVAATANRIESLPAEVIRKGRFDEVFFCDLPTEDERREIIRIHLRRNAVDPDGMDVERLLYPTRGWTGAEIEQAVISARIDAGHEQRQLVLDDIMRQAFRMVPLSETMAEQIKALRDWSHQRATRASQAPPPSMLPDGQRG